MSNISPQKNARTPEQNISLRNLCKNFWLEETAILDMQMSKLPMISGYVEAITNPRWLLWSLIGRDIFNFFSRTTGCEVTRLAKNVPVSQKSNVAAPASD